MMVVQYFLEGGDAGRSSPPSLCVLKHSDRDVNVALAATSRFTFQQQVMSIINLLPSNPLL